MKTVLLPAAPGVNLQHAADLLRRGGLVAFPTDTVYGLGAAAFDEDAVRRIYAVKSRTPDKAIPILISSAEEIHQVAVDLDERTFRLAERFWPGPLTLVVRKNERVPNSVSGRTVGIRVPNHPVALALLELTGPLAVTSANISGEPSPLTAAEVAQQLDDRVDLILDGGLAPGGIPSTVVDCTGDELAVLRPGPLTLEMLLVALADVHGAP